MRTIVPWLAVLTSLSANAKAPCSAPGGDAWREYRVRHFVVDTPVSQAKAQALIKQLETLYSMLLDGLFGEQVDVPGHVRVVALDPADFRDLAGSSLLAGYFKRGAQPLIVVPADANADPEVLAHELAHHISHYQFPDQPGWFAEGLAGFFETIANPGEDAAPETGSHMVRGQRTLGGGVGILPRQLAYVLSPQYGDARPVPVKELFSWRGDEQAGSPARFHAWSWLLYHYLWNSKGKAFADYQKRLADGEEPELVWRGAFPDYSNDAALAQLDSELQRYQKSPRYAFYKVKANAQTQASEMPIAAADVHVLLLEARKSWPADHDAFARRELEEALREDPQNPRALAMLASLDRKSPLEDLRRIAAARPGDGYAWLALSQATGEAAEQEAALRKAVELLPDEGRAENELAWLLLQSGRAKEAVVHANRAVDLAPWNASSLDTLAHTAGALGKCADAWRLERRALAIATRMQLDTSGWHQRLQTRCPNSPGTTAR